MTVAEPRRPNAPLRRLQVLLLLMLLWDLLAVLASLSFGSGLMHVNGDQLDGALAAKASFSGAGLVPVAVYFYGLVRSPLRHPGVLWVGVVDQSAAALFSVYHVVADDLTLEGAVLTTVVSVLLLALLIINMPRGDLRG